MTKLKTKLEKLNTSLDAMELMMAGLKACLLDQPLHNADVPDSMLETAIKLERNNWMGPTISREAYYRMEEHSTTMPRNQRNTNRQWPNLEQ